MLYAFTDPRIKPEIKAAKTMGFIDFLKNRNEPKDMETAAMVTTKGTKRSIQSRHQYC